jgi:hypothetical protein
MIVWAPWHPEHGFDVPSHLHYGWTAGTDLDDVCRLVRELNAEAGTNNRNGWRAAKARLERAPS